MSHYEDPHVFYARHQRENRSGRRGSVSLARQTHLRKLIFSSNFSLFVQIFPRRVPCEYTSQEIEWHPLLLRGFYFVQPGRRTAPLICPDAAFWWICRSLKQSKQRRKDGSFGFLWTLCGKAPLLQVSADIIAVQICVFTPISLHLICFAVPMKVIIRPACSSTWINLLF